MINIYYLKNINIEQLQAHSCSFSQGVSRLLWKNKFHYSAHKIPRLLPKQSQTGSMHTQKTPHSFKLRGDISKICPPSFRSRPSSGKLKIRSLSRLGLQSFQIHFNIIVPFITTSQRQTLLYDSSDENSARFSHHSHACYITRPSHTPYLIILIRSARHVVTTEDLKLENPGVPGYDDVSLGDVETSGTTHSTAQCYSPKDPIP
jgi:hypothetical protein